MNGIKPGTMPQCSLLLKLAAESNKNMSRSSQTNPEQIIESMYKEDYHYSINNRVLCSL